MNYFDNFIIGAVIAPTALFLNAFASFQLPESLQKLSPLIPALQSNWLMMHVTVMLFSYATLICGCILAITFLFLFESQFENIFNHSNTFFSGNRFTESLGDTPDFKEKQQTKWSIYQDQVSQKDYVSQSAPSLRATEPEVPPEGTSGRDTFGDEPQNVASRSFERNGVNSTPLSHRLDAKAKLDRGSPSVRVETNQIQSCLYPLEPGADKVHSIPRDKIRGRWLLLKKLDQLSFRSIGIGFPFLTIGILSGSIWANEAWGSYWNWDPKETWSLITWLIFAIYLHLRLTQNWNGLKSAILATVGFFSVWICFLGVNFLAKGLHSYGWFHS